MEAKGKKKNINFILIIVFSIVSVVFLRLYVFSNYEVEGESMMPTLQDGNLLIVDKLDARFGKIERFDIIVFQGRHDDYVKRVIGLPGDKLEYRDDSLYINDKKIEEPFLYSYKQRLIGGNLTGDFTLDEITGEDFIPEGYYFVIGDNRLGSWDSRHFGLVSHDKIVGKVFVRYWPREEWEMNF